jgi:hypothetical protein
LAFEKLKEQELKKHGGNGVRKNKKKEPPMETVVLE